MAWEMLDAMNDTAVAAASTSTLSIHLPRVLAVDESMAGNEIRQVVELGARRDGTLEPYSHRRLRGFIFSPVGGADILLIPKTSRIPEGHDRVIRATVDPDVGVADLGDAVWLRHPLLPRPGETVDYAAAINRVLESWVGAFSYVLENRDRGIKGLRSPQVGAVHAAHAHWSVSEGPATIVMPTGTGKTETMLSILTSTPCPKLLVVVPTDALRTQLVEKFLSLGVLKDPDCSILLPTAEYPIVATLRHIPRTAQEVDDIFERAQVVVTTSHIAGQCEQAIQDRMAQLCPYLFIDEAHHVEAPTWSAFKGRFSERRILQFTATPFREDGRPLDGDPIFIYPLRKAQQEDYFKPIHFEPVVEFNRRRSDEAIAVRAVERLKVDADKGHVLMARVDSVARAAAVFPLYERYPEFNPVQLHTGIKSLKLRDAIRRKIISGESRIVVCVDMLGEGFDLPELKIAAFHDIRKTLAVTLQLAGRFTRSRPDLGDATFIANTADVDVRDELRKLYTRDPDWNVLLPELSDQMIGEQLSLQEFLRGFTSPLEEVPVKTIRPATSAVVYRTTCRDWTPEKFRVGIPALGSCEQVYETINHAERTLVVITARRVPLVWCGVENLFSWDWELYVVVWSPEQNLLFINSSTNAGEYKALAHAVAGETATLINGQDVFRAFAGVSRLRLQNVGLTEQLGRNVRYTGRMGSDIEPALTELQKGRARKSVLSGLGFEDGARTTVGASRKGRIWSHRRDRIDQLVAWCKAIGAKLVDEGIDPDAVLSGTLDASTIRERPVKMPICIDWPEEMYTSPEYGWFAIFGDTEYSMDELSLEMVSPSMDGPLRFVVASESEEATMELEFFAAADIPNYRFVSRGGRNLRFRRGERAEARNAVDFFYDDPPVIWFSDGSALEGVQHVELKGEGPRYDPAQIRVWDWDGVNIRKESQGEQREWDSIQAKVVRELRQDGFDVIFDDDARGEAADVVAIRLVGNKAAPSRIEVEFHHCKFSKADEPGGRVEDLYEVCGQAQKSVCWMFSPDKRTDLFSHLLRREARRRDAGKPSRFELGDGELLQTIREMSRVCPISLSIHVVQPGLSRARATIDQLRLLGVTQNYLLETYQLGFGVVASE